MTGVYWVPVVVDLYIGRTAQCDIDLLLPELVAGGVPGPCEEWSYAGATHAIWSSDASTRLQPDDGTSASTGYLGPKLTSAPATTRLHTPAIPDESCVAHMEERLSRGRGCWPLCGGWCRRGVVAVRAAVRAFAGGRDVRSCSYSGAVPRPLFVAPPPSKVERGPPQGFGLLRRRIAEFVCASRECSDRLANRNGLLVSVGVSVSQRELVSLVRVVGVGVGSGLVVVMVAISQQ